MCLPFGAEKVLPESNWYCKMVLPEYQLHLRVSKRLQWLVTNTLSFITAHFTGSANAVKDQRYFPSSFFSSKFSLSDDCGTIKHDLMNLHDTKYPPSATSLTRVGYKEFSSPISKVEEETRTHHHIFTYIEQTKDDIN